MLSDRACSTILARRESTVVGALDSKEHHGIYRVSLDLTGGDSEIMKLSIYRIIVFTRSSTACLVLEHRI